METNKTSATVPAAEYRLFVRKGAPRLYLRNTNEGVYLSPKGIGWFIDGTSYTRDWHEIAAVNPIVGYIPKNGPSGTCKITFTDGSVLSVLSASSWGHSDNERNVEYGRFLSDFHRVIPKEHRDRIRFETGVGQTQHIVMIFAFVIAALLFVALPLGLAIYFRELEALFIAGAGFAFIYPLYRMTENAAPTNYNPDQVPPEQYP